MITKISQVLRKTWLQSPISWWQSIPGFNNTIPYNNTTLENWWDIFYNWDEAIKSKKKLYK